MNPHHKPTRYVILGPSGSGKTTLARKLIAQWRTRCTFVFDPEGDWGACWNIIAARSPMELMDGLAAGLAVYDPGSMFPGRFAAGFEWFCRWTYNASQASHGPKLFVCDEIQNWTRTGASGIPGSFAQILEMGRRQELDCLFCGHAPNLIHDRIRNQATHIVVFRFTEPLALAWLRKTGLEPSQIATLPAYQFIVQDRVAGQQRTGKVKI